MSRRGGERNRCDDVESCGAQGTRSLIERRSGGDDVVDQDGLGPAPALPCAHAVADVQGSFAGSETTLVRGSGMEGEHSLRLGTGSADEQIGHPISTRAERSPGRGYRNHPGGGRHDRCEDGGQSCPERSGEKRLTLTLEPPDATGGNSVEAQTCPHAQPLRRLDLPRTRHELAGAGRTEQDAGFIAPGAGRREEERGDLTAHLAPINGDHATMLPRPDTVQRVRSPRPGKPPSPSRRAERVGSFPRAGRQ